VFSRGYVENKGLVLAPQVKQRVFDGVETLAKRLILNDLLKFRESDVGVPSAALAIHSQDEHPGVKTGPGVEQLRRPVRHERVRQVAIKIEDTSPGRRLIWKRPLGTDRPAERLGGECRPG
jgi:hypothetical protein